MANVVLWIDSDHAKIFELAGDTVTEKTLKRREIRHHTGSEKDHNHHKEGGHKFFHDVATHLEGAARILLIGPGEAKTRFRGHVESHHPHGHLGNKIIGEETVDHPTDGQIVALGKKFFSAHLRFE